MRLLLVLIMACMSLKAAAAGGPVKKTCVLSFVDTATQSTIVDEVKANLFSRGLSDFEKYLDIRVATYTTIKDCLESDYSEVVIVAHFAEFVANAPVIVWQAPNDPEKVTGTLDDRVFQKANLSPSLKKIVLYSCKSELILASYKHLAALGSKVSLETPNYVTRDTLQDLSLRAVPGASEIIVNTLLN